MIRYHSVVLNKLIINFFLNYTNNEEERKKGKLKFLTQAESLFCFILIFLFLWIVLKCNHFILFYLFLVRSSMIIHNYLFLQIIFKRFHYKNVISSFFQCLFLIIMHLRRKYMYRNLDWWLIVLFHIWTPCNHFLFIWKSCVSNIRIELVYCAFILQTIIRYYLMIF